MHSPAARNPRSTERGRSRQASVLLGLAAIAVAAVLSACGGSEEDAREVIDRGFSEPIESADVTLDADLTLEGSEDLSEPIRVQVSGPFRSGGSERIPSFDFDVALQGPDAEVPPIRLISTGDNVFVEVQGTAYEVGEESVAELNRQVAQGSEEDAPGLGALGVDPREWIVDASVEDESEVAGVPTTHVAASVDVAGLVTDLNEAAQQASEIGAEPAPTLTEEERGQLEEAVEDPSFDLFVGRDDGKIRRLTTALDFEIPEEGREDVGGIEGGTLSASIELAGVDGDQEITAPEDPQPLADLARQLGALGGILGDSEAPGGGAGPGPSAGGAGGLEAPEGAAPGEAFREYGECLRQADPADQAALEACNELIAPEQ